MSLVYSGLRRKGEEVKQASKRGLRRKREEVKQASKGCLRSRDDAVILDHGHKRLGGVTSFAQEALCATNHVQCSWVKLMKI